MAKAFRWLAFGLERQKQRILMSWSSKWEAFGVTHSFLLFLRSFEQFHQGPRVPEDYKRFLLSVARPDSDILARGPSMTFKGKKPSDSRTKSQAYGLSY